MSTNNKSPISDIIIFSLILMLLILFYDIIPIVSNIVIPFMIVGIIASTYELLQKDKNI